MIEIKNISKSFDDIKVLDDISCIIKDGAVFGIVGSNGAGKSTLLRMISGVYDIHSGTIAFDGTILEDRIDSIPSLLFLSDEVYFESADTIDIVTKRYKNIYKDFNEEKYKKLLGIFELNITQRMMKLSKGMKKQVFLSIALSSNVKYLLLDETLDGLDPLMRINIKKLIFDETMKNNMTTIVTSHSLKELEDICDGLAMIHNGKIVIQGDLDEIKRDLVKVRCAFNGEISENTFKSLNLVSYEKSGKIVTIVAKGDAREVEKEVNKLNPILVEILPITVEEVFISKLRQLGYGNKEQLEEILK